MIATIDEVAVKDVPSSLDYWIVNDTSPEIIPDREPDGQGGNSTNFSARIVDKYMKLVNGR